MLYIRSPELIHLLSGSLYPLTNISPFPSPPAPGNHHTRLWFCEFSFFILFYLFYFIFKNLYWSIIALKCCVGFCCITKWIIYMYTYIPISPLSCVSSHPPYTTPLGGHKALSWSPSAMQGAIYFTFGRVYMSILLSVYSSLPFPLPKSSRPFSMSASLFLSCP